MTTFFAFAFLASLGLMTLGIFSPKALQPLVRQIWTRGRIAAVFGGAALASFFGVGLTAPPIEPAVEELPLIADEVEEEKIEETLNTESVVAEEKTKEEVKGETEAPATAISTGSSTANTSQQTAERETESASEPELESKPGVTDTEPELEPEPESVAKTPACSCSANIYNCGDFSSHAAAQSVYSCCMAQVGYDVHDLDRDNDGDACESL